MTEELEKLEAEIKATQAAYEAGDIIFKETHKAARAYLAAQRQAPAKTPLEYFRTNIDGRKTIEVFESACNAIKKADEATVAGDAVKHEIWFNIFKCEAMRLAREYEEAPNIRAALTNSVPVEVAERAAAALASISRRPDLPNPERDADWKSCQKWSSQEAKEALRELEPWVKEQKK